MRPKHLKETLDIASSFAVIIAAGIMAWVVFMRQPDAPPPQVEDVQGLRLDHNRVRNVLGNASIALIEISDFQCPFCARYAAETLPEIRREFIEPGLARYIALHFPLEKIHGRALAAAEAAECAAAQGRFWPMHERLFSSPRALEETDLTNHARELQLNQLDFAECLAGDRGISAIRADLEEARRLGVTATPTFFLGRAAEDGTVELLRRINGSAPIDIFVRELRALLGT